MPSKPRLPHLALLSSSLVSKGGIGIVASILFALTLLVSLAGVVRDSRPALALRIAPYDAQAASSMASSLMLENPTPDTRARAKELALSAIKRDATNAVALRTLGLVRELEGDGDAAFRLMKQSEFYSRRDLLTQLWMIEYQSRAGDVQQTLRHYDTAMRASVRAQEMLVPTLVSAASDPELVGPIRTLIADKPVWWRTFANALITNGSPNAAVAVTSGFLSPDIPEERALTQNLLTRLSNESRFELAWRAFIAARVRANPNWSPQAIRNGNFEGADALPLFDWLFAEESDLNANRIQRPSGNGFALELTARGERSGNVAFQMLHLSHGRYDLEYTAGGTQSRASAPPSISVNCAAGPALTTVAASRVGEGGAKHRGQFTVPTDCPWQWLTVRASAARDESAGPVWIDGVILRSVAR